MSNDNQPRIVPPEEARTLMDATAVLKPGALPLTLWDASADLAHTAAVLGEQRAAALALIPTANPELIEAGYAIDARDMLNALGVNA